MEVIFLLLFIAFVAASALLFAALFPILMNLIILPVTKVGETVEGIGLFDWKICFQNMRTVELSLTGAFLLVALMLFVYSSVTGEKRYVGEEYGTAKWLEDSFFNKLVPHYTFHKNEYDYTHQDMFNDFDIYEETSVLDRLEMIENGE